MVYSHTQILLTWLNIRVLGSHHSNSNLALIHVRKVCLADLYYFAYTEISKSMKNVVLLNQIISTCFQRSTKLRSDFLVLFKLQWRNPKERPGLLSSDSKVPKEASRPIWDALVQLRSLKTPTDNIFQMVFKYVSCSQWVRYADELILTLYGSFFMFVNSIFPQTKLLCLLDCRRTVNPTRKAG